MPKLQGELGEEFENTRQAAVQYFRKGDHSAAIQLLTDAWEKLPEGKYEYDESFIIVWYILDNAIECRDIDTMKKWVDKVFLADPKRGDYGEREMWAGRVAYESGETEKALEYLRVAYKKSKGRVFGDTDKKYKAFLIDNGL